MTELASLRTGGAKFLLGFLALHIPMILVLTVLTGASLLVEGALTLAAVGAAFAAWFACKECEATRYVLAVAVICMPAIVVQDMAGLAWQIDMHMYFFAALAMLAVLCDWRVILLATLTVAVHHLALNFVLPAAVFPDGMSITRVLLHAAIIIVEAATLMWLTRRMAASFEKAAEAVATAQEAQELAEQARKSQQEAEDRATVEKAEAMNALAATFEAEAAVILDQVVDQIGALQKEGQEMLAVSDETRGEAEHVSTAADRSNSNVQTVATASDELRASIQDIAAQSTQVTATVSSATGKVREAQNEIQALEDAVGNIGAIVTMIQEIAEQTNLLALNATIESARVGELGKGFAVVANEVKSLANQTQEATNKISNTIEDVQGWTSKAVSSISDVNGHITEIEERITSVTAAIEQQDAATREISQSAVYAADDVEQGTQRMARMGQVAGRADQAATGVVGALDTLSSQAANLNDKVAHFLDTVRAS